MTNSHKLDYFETHWRSHDSGQIPSGKRKAAERFLSFAIQYGKKNVARRWLDVGAGNGVHLSILHSLSGNTELWGVDISLTAIRTASAMAPSAHLLVADGEILPFETGIMDVTFAYGVLAYMNNSARGIAELVRVTRSGGLVGTWFFPRPLGVVGLSLRVVRAIVSRLPPFWQARCADVLVPLLGLMPTTSGLHLGNASWQECREIVLVNVAPSLLSFPTRDEIALWLEELGCRILFEDLAAPITLWAEKLHDVQRATPNRNLFQR